MTVTIPRAEIDAIAVEHWGVGSDLDFDPTVEWVRAAAKVLRQDAGAGRFDQSEILAEADDLDALADRYGREAA